MKKLIMILSMLCMLGAIVLGVMNKNFLETTRADLKRVKDEVRVVTQDLGEKEDERDGLKDTESKARDVRNMASAAVEEAKQGLKMVQRKIDGLKPDLERINIEQREIDMAVKRTFPDGNIKSPDDLRMILTMLQDNLSTNQQASQGLTTEIDKLNMQKAAQLSRVGDQEEYQIKRAQKIALGELEAVIVAVNPEWGFVMVNAGRAHGVEPDSSLLIKRGNARIGRLRIINLQENVCVCDIVKGSVPRGMKIDVGDSVIFENPFQ